MVNAQGKGKRTMAAYATEIVSEIAIGITDNKTNSFKNNFALSFIMYLLY